MKSKEKHPERTIRPPASDADAVMSASGDQQGVLRLPPELVGKHKKERRQASASTADADLLRRVAEGDWRAIETVYLRHSQDLLNFIVRRYRWLDEHAAEDVVSDVFLRLFQHRHNLRITRNIRNYLLSVARSMVDDRYEGQLAADRKFSADTQSSNLSPHVAMEQDEMAQQVTQAVDSLAESHRLALELSQTGSSAKQIAALSNCTEKAARRRVEKAKEQLKLALSRCGRSCVMGTPRQEQCPALTKELYCLKRLYAKKLRSQ